MGGMSAFHLSQRNEEKNRQVQKVSVSWGDQDKQWQMENTMSYTRFSQDSFALSFPQYLHKSRQSEVFILENKYQNCSSLNLQI
jgi:hypothetical protein